MASYKKLNEEDLEICKHTTYDLVVADRKKRRKKPNPYTWWISANGDASEMGLLENFLDRLAREDYSDMFPEPIVDNKNRVIVPGGQRRWRFQVARLPKWIALVRSLPSECRYSEGVELFLSLCNDYSLPHNNRYFSALCNPPSMLYPETGESYEKMREIVNAFIKDLHLRLRERKTRKKILDRRRAVEKNYQEFIEYVDKLFDRIARHLVLRIDLAYKKEGVKVSIEDFVKDLDHFHANMRHNKLFEYMTGFIEKIEYGVEKGVHTHLILFFDGSKRKNDTHLAKEIGEYWSNQITKGQGSYWNCNDPEYKKEFEKIGGLGIGEIHAEDKEKRANLNSIIRYFCKSEQFIKLKTKQKMKLLRKGLRPKQTGLKRGAPRASQRIVRLPYAIGDRPAFSS
jgi:hypothetical protein